MDYGKSTNIQDRLTHDAVIAEDGKPYGFKASEFVQVMNVDDDPFKWEFCTEETIQPDASGTTATRESKVEKFSLEPGQTTEMPGNIALVFIEGLTKHLIQKDGKARMINIVSVQDEWINRIFLGKKGVSLPYATNNVDPETQARTFRAAELNKEPIEEVAFPAITKSVTTPETPRVGRPTKATT